MEINRFYGSYCMSCKGVFGQGDDIVVCPECGTPYHRECYKKEGRCINEPLHASGISWKPMTEEEAAVAESSENGTIRCMRCGEENTADMLFCTKCGLPLHQDEPPERPFNDIYSPNRYPSGNQGGQQQGAAPFPNTIMLDKNSEIDGITIEDYVCYIKSNPIYFVTTFFRFFKLKTKISFNFGAVLFPEFYMLYRKMYVRGILMLILSFLLSVPSYIILGSQDFMGQVFIEKASFIEGNTFQLVYQASNYALWAVRLILGFSVNYLYYSSVKKRIRRIKAENPEPNEARQIMALAGGVSWPAVIMGATLMFGMFTALMFVMNHFIK
ncbi:MAG: DUF2628 domain-containing protein [Ruminococcus sp.]|nr:DUF2628 domain-containing protein [Ruminococcus sp.]